MVYHNYHHCPLQVRRHQLRQLLESEYQQQEAELHNMGLTFHKDRL